MNRISAYFQLNLQFLKKNFVQDMVNCRLITILLVKFVVWHFSSSRLKFDALLSLEEAVIVPLWLTYSQFLISNLVMSDLKMARKELSWENCVAHFLEPVILILQFYASYSRRKGPRHVVRVWRQINETPHLMNKFKLETRTNFAIQFA